MHSNQEVAVESSTDSMPDQFRNVDRFDVTGKTLLIPDMSPAGSRLLAASFRAFGVRAEVMETYTGLNLGMEHTSGKECFPCQVTLGDILYHLKKEQQRRGDEFEASDYVYFMPEADGPCRFGMYNKMHRMVLDRYPEFREVPILYVSTGDGYSSRGILPPKLAKPFRKMAYAAAITGDLLDRICWRTRPYEQEAGQADALIDDALQRICQELEAMGPRLDHGRLGDLLAGTAQQAAQIIDPECPRRPRVGIVGEIYIRSHPTSNQEVIRQLEQGGAEVVNASIGEWIQFVTYERIQTMKKEMKDSCRRLMPGRALKSGQSCLGSVVELRYMEAQQDRLYQRVLNHLDIQSDHRIAHVHQIIEQQELFDFAIGTEAPLSIGGALEYVDAGFNGVVNLYPFTCMPSTIASSILKPRFYDMHVPYLDISCDDSASPSRQLAIQTFLYQVQQHAQSCTAADQG
ncbi:CoA activase [Desulfurispira natronophila]|uniref:Putative nucleotide-binding protein (Sugar kinase/HSP70/actin superfamily) n=1 Tax=Desulfurispira natronophila TaxID=682562 RepID=A0A7W7Y5X1_9BACT|nr:CoA activase [Desulfurispira natronophila]MBB5022690.1 putative nucleotide-binding protein (sugar kinase/HSP70/actin superfamily) [Desulfurispira natronophila]